MKAVTFSYDDGVTQDIRLVEILNRYGLKATFNLNSELLGKDGCLDILGKKYRITSFSRTKLMKFTKLMKLLHTLSPILT